MVKETKRVRTFSSTYCFLYHRSNFIGLINLNLPFDTNSNNSEFPPGFPFRCLYKNAEYVPGAKPGQAFSNSILLNGSFNFFVPIAFTIDS